MYEKQEEVLEIAMSNKSIFFVFFKLSRKILPNAIRRCERLKKILHRTRDKRYHFPHIYSEIINLKNSFESLFRIMISAIMHETRDFLSLACTYLRCLLSYRNIGYDSIYSSGAYIRTQRYRISTHDIQQENFPFFFSLMNQKKNRKQDSTEKIPRTYFACVTCVYVVSIWV